ncbi:MAG: hypothetical protein BHW12_07880 [Coprobacillus sp. 28_7]|nr:MAG: hypothetical protein BHW12_07880 [Coprobacillus sp. 28_7]
MFALVWKTAFIYFLILLTLRFMGKREVGQLGLFDFVVLLLIADVSAITLDDEKSIYTCLIPVIILSLIQKILVVISLHVPFVRNIVDGKESVIMYEGKLNIKEMKKQNYNVDDLLSQLRLKNVKSLSQVEYLILENSGDISVFLYEENEKKPLSYSKGKRGGTGSSSVSTTVHTITKDISIFPLVISGKIIEENLKLQNIKKPWLLEEIKRQGFDLKNVYYANMENNKLFIVRTCSF